MNLISLVFLGKMTGDRLDRTKSDADYLRVRDYLLDAIKSETLPFGRLPTERHIAEQFEVGRGLARKALTELKAEGLIYRHVGRGTFISSGKAASPATAVNSGVGGSPSEYLEARLRFEPEMAWMIVANATAADLERLRDQHKRSKNADTAKNFEICDADFHEALANATHNSIAIDQYRIINDIRRRVHLSWAYTRVSEQSAEQRGIFVNEHDEILTALGRRDAKAARDAWSKHIRNTKRRVMDY